MKISKYLKKYEFETVYRMLEKDGFVYSLDNIVKMFPKCDSQLLYVFLMYSIAKNETVEKHIAICECLRYINPYIRYNGTMIYWHTMRAITIDENGIKALSWAIKVFSKNSNSPFSDEELNSFAEHIVEKDPDNEIAKSFLERMAKEEVSIRYDVVIIDKAYRGMGRMLTGEDLWKNKKSKKEYNDLSEAYWSYLKCIAGETDTNFWEQVISLYKKLRKYDIPCEVIVYDKTPLDEFLGYSLELLGLDIVHEMCESLICDEVNPDISHLLNENGLCRTEEDVEKVIPFQDYGGLVWKPCYVYKVLVD